MIKKYLRLVFLIAAAGAAARANYSVAEVGEKVFLMLQAIFWMSWVLLLKEDTVVVTEYFPVEDLDEFKEINLPTVRELEAMIKSDTVICNSCLKEVKMSDVSSAFGLGTGEGGVYICRNCEGEKSDGGTVDG